MSCPPTFDEHSVFTSPDAPILKERFRRAFQNISRIMDCVECEKCRLWGKLQTTGTANTKRRVALRLMTNATWRLF